MTKQASATVSPADDPTRTFASGQRCQRVVDVFGFQNTSLSIE